MTTLQGKRQRGKNFSVSEESILIDLVYINKDIVEKKQSDAATWREKDQCWEKLAIEFAHQCGIVRTARALRDKYENIKRKYKTETAAEKQKTRQNSSNSFEINCLDFKSKLAAIINTPAKKLRNTIDSDNSKVSSNDDSATASLIDEVSSITPNIKASQSEDDANPLELWKEGMEDLEDPVSATTNFTPIWSPAIEEEKIRLIKLQQKFYRDENIRAAEKHKEDIKLLRLKSELLELEVAEKKKRLLMD